MSNVQEEICKCAKTTLWHSYILADAPAHHLFALLGPDDDTDVPAEGWKHCVKSTRVCTSFLRSSSYLLDLVTISVLCLQNAMPDVLAVVQVALEGAISSANAQAALARGNLPQVSVKTIGSPLVLLTKVLRQIIGQTGA